MDHTAAMDAADKFSVYRLVIEADPIVQAVMAMLVIASLGCWAIIFEKMFQLTKLRFSIGKLEEAANDPHSAGANASLSRKVMSAAEAEQQDGGSAGEGRNEIRARLEMAMRAAVKTELRRLESGLPFLATVGSAGPFVGLFGTVWGIMNSFTSIAQAKDTSLAVVAPGIAEALFATALGLAAAIPAVIAYNQISVSLGRASARMGTSVTKIAKQRTGQQNGGQSAAGASQGMRL